jgi:hypothetical protein
MCGNFVALETKMDLKVKILLIAFSVVSTINVFLQVWKTKAVLSILENKLRWKIKGKK